MKKMFAVLCALLLVPTIASAELISITELVQETPEAWIEEIDVNGKTISIDAPIYVPEVETLPVLKVTMIEANDDAVQAYVNDGWEVVEGYPEYRYGVRIYKENENVSDENLHQHEYEIANDYWQFERTHDLDEVYAQNQEKPIGEFARMMEKGFNDIFDFEETKLWLEKVNYFVCAYSTKPFGEVDWANVDSEGGYMIEAKQMIRGVPINLTAPVCFDNGEVDCNWAYKTYDMLYGYYRNSGRYTIMYENAFKETKELYSDMKVCDFETARADVRRYIEEKKIDQVYSMALTYVVYAEPGKAAKKADDIWDFVLVPTWVLKCRYIEGKKQKDIEPLGEKMPYDTDDFENERCFETVLINAQTGEVYSPKKTGMEKYCMPTIIQ